MASRALVGESRLRAKRLRERTIYTLVSLCGIALFAIALIALSWLPRLRLTGVVVEGVQTVSDAAVMLVAQQVLAGTYGHVLPKNSIILYPRETLESELRKTYPLFADVSVYRRGMQGLVVSVVERQASALWCTQEKCFFMDASGVVYGTSGTTSVRALVQYSGPAEGDTLPKQFMTPESFHRLSLLVSTLAAQISTSTTVTRVALNEEGDVDAVLDSGCTIRFSTGQDTAVVLQHLALALSSKPFTTTPLSEVAYIDLRFGQKLYYKLK